LTAYTIGGILMDSQTPDELGIVYSVAITGWDSPDTRTISDAKNSDDGEYDSPQFYAARFITATLFCELPTPSLYLAAKDKLSDALEVNQSIQVMNMDEGRTVTGVRLGKLLMRVGGNGYAPTKLDANFQIKCKDPRKYGQSTLVSTGLPSMVALVPPLVPPLITAYAGGSMVINNTGKYKTPGVITFNGPITGPFWVQNTRLQRKIQYVGNLASGDVLEVDLRRGTVILNGAANRRGLLTPDSRLWYFDKGITTLTFGSAAFSTGTVQVTYAPAWMG
jgi:hypothetical protein